MFITTPRYLILVQLLKSSNSKRELHNKQKLVKDEVTMCVGSVSEVDVIKHRMLPLLSRFGVCVEHDWIMFIAIRLFI